MITNWKQCWRDCPQIIYKCTKYINMQLFYSLYPTRNLLENTQRLYTVYSVFFSAHTRMHARARTHTHINAIAKTVIHVLKYFCMLFGTSFHFFIHKNKLHFLNLRIIHSWKFLPLYIVTLTQTRQIIITSSSVRIKGNYLGPFL